MPPLMFLHLPLPFLSPTCPTLQFTSMTSIPLLSHLPLPNLDHVITTSICAQIGTGANITCTNMIDILHNYKPYNINFPWPFKLTGTINNKPIYPLGEGFIHKIPFGKIITKTTPIHTLKATTKCLIWHQCLVHPSDEYIYTAHKFVDGVSKPQSHPILLFHMYSCQTNQHMLPPICTKDYPSISPSKIQIASHAIFDEGINDLPINVLLSDVMRLNWTTSNVPVPVKDTAATVDDFFFCIIPFDTLLTQLSASNANPPHSVSSSNKTNSEALSSSMMSPRNLLLPNSSLPTEPLIKTLIISALALPMASPPIAHSLVNFSMPTLPVASNIGFSISTLSKFSIAPAPIHYKYLKSAALYLGQTIHWDLHFQYSTTQPHPDVPIGSFSNSPIPLPPDLPTFPSLPTGPTITCFVDAAYGNICSHRKPTSGISILLANGDIIYKSKTQTHTALSSTEAKFYVAVSAAKLVVLYL
eukprot:jgi/Psemu1/54030/gm1.54030_g